MTKTRKLVAVAGVAVGIIGLASAQPAPKPGPPAMKAPPPPPVDYAGIAEKVVSASANVKEGDIVQIIAGPQDLTLLEELVVAVRKRGAFALPTLQSESTLKKLIATTPDKYDTQPQKLDTALNKIINVQIVVPAVRDANIWMSVPAERRAKLEKQFEAAADVMRKRNVRYVELGNGFAPSAGRARELGISEADLTRIYWDGLSADFTAVQAKCESLKNAIAGGKELKITHSNGTDVTIKLKGKKVLVSDGIITDAEAKAGGPGVQVWLPAGEVYFVPGTSQGKVVDDRNAIGDKVVEGVVFEVKGGKATSVTAKANWDVVKSRWDLAGPGKTELSVVDLGCNPSIKAGPFESFVGAGMVTLTFGGNAWAGGTNKEPWFFNVQLTGTNVLLDGKPLIKDGALQ